MPRIAVAFSGGVDSTVVAKAAVLARGDAATAYTSDSPSVPRTELESTRTLAARIGIRHHILPTQEFANPDYSKNDGSRCYFCKSELYSTIMTELASDPDTIVCSGANLDDLGDYRPGLVAAREHAVRHPLQEAGFGKAHVRTLAMHWDLPNWDKPASPCLASRIAPGVPATADRTSRVEAAEAYLHQHGFTPCRVRYHEGDLARIEVPTEHLARLVSPDIMESLTRTFQDIGFRFVTVDLLGLRSGNMNELIPLEIKARYRISIP